MSCPELAVISLIHFPREDRLERPNGDPAAELCQEALMRGLVWVEAILHLEGEGVGRLLRQVG